MAPENVKKHPAEEDDLVGPAETPEDFASGGVVPKEELTKPDSPYYQRIEKFAQNQGDVLLRKEIERLKSERAKHGLGSEEVKDYEKMIENYEKMIERIKEQIKELEKILNLNYRKKREIIDRLQRLCVIGDNEKVRLEPETAKFYDHSTILSSERLMTALGCKRSDFSDESPDKIKPALFNKINEVFNECYKMIFFGKSGWFDEPEDILVRIETFERLKIIYDELESIIKSTKEELGEREKQLNEEYKKGEEEVKKSIKKRLFEKERKYETRLEEAVAAYRETPKAQDLKKRIVALDDILKKMEEVLGKIAIFKEKLPERKKVLDEKNEIENEIKKLETEKKELEIKLKDLEEKKDKAQKDHETKIATTIKRAIENLSNGQSVSKDDIRFIEETAGVWERFKREMSKQVKIWPEDIEEAVKGQEKLEKDTIEKNILFNPAKVMELSKRNQLLERMVGPYELKHFNEAPTIREIEQKIREVKSLNDLEQLREDFYFAITRRNFYRIFQDAIREHPTDWEKIDEKVNLVLWKLRDRKLRDKEFVKEGSPLSLALYPSKKELEELTKIAEPTERNKFFNEMISVLQLFGVNADSYYYPLDRYCKIVFLELLRDNKLETEHLKKMRYLPNLLMNSAVSLATMKYELPPSLIPQAKQRLREIIKEKENTEVLKVVRLIMEKYKAFGKLNEIEVKTSIEKLGTSSAVPALDVFLKDMEELGFVITPDESFRELKL